MSAQKFTKEELFIAAAGIGESIKTWKKNSDFDEFKEIEEDWLHRLETLQEKFLAVMRETP